MDGYICIKACTLGGADYNAGDHIPTEAVLPNRVRALTRQGYIASATTPQTTAASDTLVPPQDAHSEPPEATPVVIPIKTKDGWIELNMTPDDVAGAISVLQMNAEDAVKAVEDIPNEEPLILIDALEDRKTVKTAILARVEALKAAETDGQGKDQDKTPEGASDAENGKNGDPDKEPGGDGQAGGQKQGDA